ncbi:MAG: Gp49 family protein [Pseudomonas sp.]
MNDKAFEQEILDKGLTAPRITPGDVERNIRSEFYFTAGEGVLGQSQMGTKPAGNADSLNRLTFCVLVLGNGFTVTGESACVSATNFDAEIGKKVARQNAITKIWPLMGYELTQRLSGQVSA